MKKALKIIVPILLALAIVVSAVWYFIQYDRGFTQDILISCARKAEENGNHRLSTFFYDWAYRQSDEDEIVAIELAEQYKLAGNYTKAEYTLSNAISDGGSAQLYIALCKTYVEQSKLLDAVNMLNNISDPEIKAQLDEMRPKVPIGYPEPGSYNEYIEVPLNAVDGTICFSTGTSFPSAKNLYRKPIQLTSGQNTIQAVVIGDNGLVSPLLTLSYIVIDVVEEVKLEDPAIDAEVRNILQVEADHILYSNELWQIKELTVPADTKSLNDLQHLRFLEKLTIDQVDFESYESISKLNALSELVILNTDLTTAHLNVIGKLPELKYLTIAGCGISVIDSLSTSTKLTHLDLNNNAVRDLEPIKNLRELEYLNLSHNAVSDLSQLKDLPKLNWLDISYNTVTSLSPLAGCTKLSRIYVQNNALTSLSGIEQLTSLTYLYAAHNQLTDVSLIAANTTLTDLDLSYNAITDITAFSTLNKLQNFNFSHNQVTSLPEFPKNSNLIFIDGTNNQISTLEPLADLTHLNKVYMDYNAQITSVDCLSTCNKLMEVRVLATGVTNVSKLKDLGVVVAYAPVGVPPEDA